ncbi:MAG: substrate-binding domain-containing protein [Bacteroidales bacterium]|nr:substrate-binding domain-containing protein [Bacteroidales bacterium]
MKNYLLVILILLSGCVRDIDRNPGKQMVIGFSQCTMIDEWRKAMVEDMGREITFYRDLNIELIVKDAADNNDKQIADINELVSKGIDLLIVSPNEAEPLTPTVERVFSEGIPVIVVDRKINSTKYTAFIGADNLAIGKEAGYFAEELLKGKGKVLEITGLKGSTPARERSAGFHEIIDKLPNITTVKVIEGAWLESRTLELTDSLFRVFNDFNLIFAHNDFMANAASKSARKYNLKPYIIGVDGMNTPAGGVSMVLNGFIDGTIFYPSGGDKAIQIAIQILTGRSFEKNIDLNTYRIDNTNARTLWLQRQQLNDQQDKIDKQSDQLNIMSDILQKRRTMLLLTYTTIILLVLIVSLILRSWRHKSKMNMILDEKNKTIIKQNEIITKQRDDSLDLLIVAEEARENKLRLFTDLSHELRTVVTLIISPIQDILNLAHDESVRKKIMILQRSTERLIRLTDGILKFRSIEINKYHLTYFSGNIAQFIANIMETFQEQASKKDITLISEIENELYAEFDLGVIEKVMYNLLSNAIKFSNRSGVVTVSLKSENSKIVINVKDCGIGIPKNELPFIFNRFYKINNPNYTSENDNIGIGLALSKELIQLHGGKIAVESVENFGTNFIISIPQFHIKSDSEINNKTNQLADLSFDLSSPTDKNKTILVVEDNPDLLLVITDILIKYYNVISAHNGKEGLAVASRKLPDLILSDILMPVMDGMKMCIEIKENPMTCHIPVILLTAIDSEENMIKGFDIGADAYITKPFNEYLLLSNIKSLIESRQKMQQFFCPSPYFRELLQTKDMAEGDFINNCLNYIYENLVNENYTLDNLSKNMNMSRSSLYRKIIEVTKLRPVDFIKKAKLNYAAKLILSNNNWNINEISWKSGFSDAKYFSKCFYHEFGINPSQFSKDYLKNKHITTN